MSNRTIASAPGVPNTIVPFTPVEEAERQAETDIEIDTGLRRDLRRGFKVEGLARITALVPAWDSFEEVELLLSISNMLNIGNMTPAQSLANDVRLYVRDTAIPKLVGLTLAQLQAVDPTAADPFDDGTPWPV